MESSVVRVGVDWYGGEWLRQLREEEAALRVILLLATLASSFKTV